MSARAPRRRFAAPFVLTLATIPACTVQSAPPPQEPHRNPPGPHENPPGPTDTPKEPAPAPELTPVSNPPRPDTPVTQTEPAPGPEKPRGYRQWTVTRSGTKCESMVKVHCPEGAMCNPPPPAKYVCPKDLEDSGKMDIIQNAEKGDCFVDFGEFKCPPKASCNPPRPQKVACPK